MRRTARPSSTAPRARRGVWRGAVLGLVGALALAATTTAGLAAPALGQSGATPAPTPAAPLASPASAPTPVYPSVSGPPPSSAAPSLIPLDSDEHGFGDRLAADGRVIPALQTVTESIQFAVLHSERPHADLDTLIMLARSQPLEGRILMLTLDVADPGADEAAQREDAEATARAMVLEYRTGMPVDPSATGPDGFPLLDPPWLMMTVMLPPAEDDAGLEPVVHLATGTGVTAAPDLADRLEQDLRGVRAGTAYTPAFEDAVRTAVEHSTPSEQVRAAAAEDSLFADRPAWQWALVGALLLALAAVVATALRRRRRRADPARDAHAADPARFAHAGEDPALRLRALTELLALAADAPGARALPQARDATAAVVEHTLALDALAPGSRQGRPDAFRRSVRPELEDRVGRAGATLRVLVAAGRDARPAVRFPDAVLEAAR